MAAATSFQKSHVKPSLPRCHVLIRKKAPSSAHVTEPSGASTRFATQQGRLQLPCCEGGALTSQVLQALLREAVGGVVGAGERAAEASVGHCPCAAVCYIESCGYLISAAISTRLTASHPNSGGSSRGSTAVGDHAGRPGAALLSHMTTSFLFFCLTSLESQYRRPSRGVGNRPSLR